MAKRNLNVRNKLNRESVTYPMDSAAARCAVSQCEQAIEAAQRGDVESAMTAIRNAAGFQENWERDKREREAETIMDMEG